MHNRIAVICPSRGRADRIGACVQSFYETSVGIADLYVCVDESDEQLEQYGPAMKGWGILLVGPDMTACPKLNWAWSMLRHNSIIGYVGDDCLFKTQGWDQILMNRYHAHNGTGIFYTADGHHNISHSTHHFATNNILNKIGYFAHPDLVHLWVDTMTFELGKRSGLLTYIPDILIEHMHFTTGKSQEDDTYRRANSKHSWDVGQDVFNQWKNGEGIKDDLAKLEAIKCKP